MQAACANSIMRSISAVFVLHVWLCSSSLIDQAAEVVHQQLEIAVILGQEGLLHAPGKCMEECGICRLVCPENAIAYAEVSRGGCQGGNCEKCGRKGSCQGCGGRGEK